MYCISDSVLFRGKNAIRKLNNILIPILLNGEIVFFIKGIEKDNKITNLYGFGGNLYAKEVNKHLQNPNIIEIPALLQDYFTGQSFLFNEDKFLDGKEFNLFPIGSNSGCYSCKTVNDSIVSSTNLFEHFIELSKQNKNEKNEIITQ
jgi:hypothetical protein